MKIVLKFSKAELSKAVADYAVARLGKAVKGDVSFTVSADYDFHDRPTGTHSVSASFEYDDEAKP